MLLYNLLYIIFIQFYKINVIILYINCNLFMIKFYSFFKFIDISQNLAYIHIFLGWFSKSNTENQLIPVEFFYIRV